MSHADDTVEDKRAAFGTDMRRMLDMIGYFTVTLTRRPQWQAARGLLLDSQTKETVEAAPFTGIGFYARPALGKNIEAIVVRIGAAADMPAIVGLRDEDTRSVVAKDFQDDETGVYNTQVILKMTKDGKILACPTSGGAPVALALKSDVDAAITAHNGHTHSGVTAGIGITGPANTVAPAAVGTRVFLGQ